jgi:hypothetical protein
MGVTTALAGLVVVGGATTAQGAEKSVNICHRTTSDTHPYNYQVVAANSTQLQGHLEHRKENGGGEDKYWGSDGVWNGMSHNAGEFKPDYIEGYDSIVPTGDAEGKAFCQAETVTEEPVTVEIPAAPQVTDPCGPDNATWVKPEDTEEVTWEIDGEGHLIARITGDLEFTDGTDVHDYGVAPDSGVACGGGGGGTTAVTPEITYTDLCGTADDTVDGVAKTGYTFTVDTATGTVSFSPAPGYHLAGGVTELAAPWTDAPCPEPEPEPEAEAEPEAVEATDVCPNLAGAQATVPSGSTLVHGECLKDEVKGVEKERPRPPVKPAVAQPAVAQPAVAQPAAAVPTVVDAGLVTPSGSSDTSRSPLGQGLVAAGLLMLVGAGSLRTRRRQPGAHQA